MDGDDDTGAAPEEPAEAWLRLKESFRQTFERQDNPFGPPAPPSASDDLVPLTQLVNLGTGNGAALAIWCEERIRSGQIVAHGIKSVLDLLNEALGRYQPIPYEAWAGLAIDWWTGSAIPVEHHRSAAQPTWRHLHIARSDLPDPQDLPEDGGGLLLTLGTAGFLAIYWRWREAVPADWPWRPGAFFRDRPDLLPHPAEIWPCCTGR
jgi:hypothetical protein